MSTSVLMALNSLPDFDAESSDETLFDRIDPDALDALFRSNGAVEREEGQIRFPIDDYEVVVEANGDIVIRARRSA